ncbi:hypothetical protein AK88_05245 [Plasmodium fragile]|uniref:Schizont-infected cell agglutination extracellular alpha domain-containing protein n=1 Tax=Plasmodium fragile TaxID=5857 RepID=A0A0D9QDK7_PLAFR|nr:uncharacterized protein AK88_05245 [Plasmodium fragile]KJP85120.1 hypothetical protein AK88_05245 [Plasmodium fragile]
MNDDSQYDNATNCGNAYWEHPTEHGQPDQRPRAMNRSKERVICRLMTQAIYFANAWSEAARKNAEETGGRDKEIKGIMRCTIADIYQDILRTYACEGWWGTYYAWYVVGEISASIKRNWGEQDCKKGKYKTIELNTWPMRNQMKTWLQENHQVQEQLAQEQIGDDCKGAQVKLEVGPREQEQQKDKDNQTKDEVKKKVTGILNALEKQMRQEEEKLRASHAKAPTYPSGEQADDKHDAAIEKEMEQAIDKVHGKLDAVIAKTAAEQAAAAKAAATTPPKESAGTTPADAGGGHQNGEKPSSPSPSPGRTGQGSTGGTSSQPGRNTEVGRADKTAAEDGAPAGSARGGPPSSTSQDPATSAPGSAGADTDNTGKCTRSTAVHVAQNAGQGIPGASSSTAVSFASGAGADDDCEHKSKDSGPGSVMSEHPTGKEQKRARKNKHNISNISQRARDPKRRMRMAGPCAPGHPRRARTEKDGSVPPAKSSGEQGSQEPSGTPAGASARPATGESTPAATPTTPAQGSSASSSTPVPDPPTDPGGGPPSGTQPGQQPSPVSASRDTATSTPTAAGGTITATEDPQDPNNPNEAQVPTTGQSSSSQETPPAQKDGAPAAAGPAGAPANTVVTVVAEDPFGLGKITDSWLHAAQLPGNKCVVDANKKCDPEVSLDDPSVFGNPGGGFIGGIPPYTDHKMDSKDIRITDPSLDVPDLTNAVLTATTPVLFFLTSVIVALLGYSLWKVSALTSHTMAHNACTTHKYNRVENGPITVAIRHSTVPNRKAKQRYYLYYPTTKKKEKKQKKTY